MAPLEEMLLRKTIERSGPPVVCAVRGLPGVGKTTLSADLARRLAVRRKFLDGIFWVTLGENPADILGLVGGLIQELGDRTYQARELQSAVGHLKTLFRAKRALIIVDDAWNAAHVRPFLADGPRCRVLVTTRQAAVCQILNASVFFVDIMTPDEALALIAAQLHRVLTGEEKVWALDLAKLLGAPAH